MNNDTNIHIIYIYTNFFFVYTFFSIHFFSVHFFCVYTFSVFINLFFLGIPRLLPVSGAGQAGKFPLNRGRGWFSPCILVLKICFRLHKNDFLIEDLSKNLFLLTQKRNTKTQNLHIIYFLYTENKIKQDTKLYYFKKLVLICFWWCVR